MKRNDFLQNFLLIILSAALAACIMYLACLGSLPVTYTSHAEVQLTGDAVHMGDVNEFAGYIEGDESLRDKVMEACSGDNGAGGTGDSGADSIGMEYCAVTKTYPETGIIDIYVRSGDPYTSHDIAEAIVTSAYSDYPASREGLSVNPVKAADVAAMPDPHPVGGYTFMAAVLGAAFGVFLSFAAVQSEREKRRRARTSDPRFARIETDDEGAYELLFAEDNEDVDPEMRELYKVTKRAEAEAAYLEAVEMEAEAAALDDMVNQPPVPDAEDGTMRGDLPDDMVNQPAASDAEKEGGDPYEE